MLKPYTRYIHKEKRIVGQCHLACRWELAEGDQTFCAQCESNVRLCFSLLFRIALSVKWPLESELFVNK